MTVSIVVSTKTGTTLNEAVLVGDADLALQEAKRHAIEASRAVT
ncbi:MAG TPA: hypothetical protein VMU69_03795 [Bradyrhizobium sp.]|nr:hypothetical protein [Bradyrhizobium sp.]